MRLEVSEAVSCVARIRHKSLGLGRRVAGVEAADLLCRPLLLLLVMIKKLSAILTPLRRSLSETHLVFLQSPTCTL